MYIITTSRKPSRKTRRFTKAIARFFNWKYVNRGKMSIESLKSISEDFWIVSEVKGNPAILVLYKDGTEHLRIGFTVSNIEKIKMDTTPPVFLGRAPLDPLIFGALPQSKAGLKLARKVDFPKKIVVKGNVLQFFYQDILIFTMKLLYIKFQKPH